MKRLAFALIIALAVITGCTEDRLAIPSETPESPVTPDTPNPPVNPDTPDMSPGEGISYVWDSDVIPDIRIEVPLQEWNTLLDHFDRDNKTAEYIRCRVIFDKDGEKTVLEDTGLRLRGNTSRRRPEAGSGHHVKDQADWQHCHYYLNFKKFNKDNKTNSIRGIKKLYLKWFKDDPSYVREVFCHDLFRKAGVWTAANDGYCRVSLHVEGDSSPAYLGIYNMLEPIDNKFIERRASGFGNTAGNLWKCTWGADLRNTDAGKFGPDDSNRDYPYELKEDVINYAAAEAQIKDFILKLNGKSDSSFKKWIQEVCDVELLLKTYAVNVAVGMWDDHWNNQNNFYLYFDSLDKYNYKFYFIPYDYDNTLGTSQGIDSGRQNPFRWGNTGMLMERMMRIPEFRDIYRRELERLTAQGNGLMYWEEAAAVVAGMQDRVRDFTANDTGEDMTVEDRPASWGNHPEYRLLGTDGNFFRIKAESILNSVY